MFNFFVNFIFNILLITGGMLVAMMAFLEIGRRVGARRLAQNPEIRSGVSTLEGAVLALLGLLIAFTFSGAMSRFDGRRQLVVEESNDIGTAYLRVDLLPGASQPAVRELFRQYLDSRLETYRLVPDMAAVNKELARSAKIQGEIWQQSIAASRLPDAHPDAAKLLLPASECDDRYHDNANDGEQDASATHHLHFAFCSRVGQFPAGRPCHGGGERAHVDSHALFFTRHGCSDLRRSRPRVSAPWIYPGGRHGSGVSRFEEQHEIVKQKQTPGIRCIAWKSDTPHFVDLKRDRLSNGEQWNHG